METAALERWLETTLGLDAAALGQGSLRRILAAALKRSGAPDAAAYLARLAEDPGEVERFAEEFLVPETWFFRDAEPFAFLRRYVAGTWRPAHPGERLRLLSAPCASGEEAYSLAMTLDEAGLPPGAFTLDAADQSARALAAAGRALYGRASFRQPLTPAQEAHFHAAGRGRRLDEAVVRQVRFRRANLVDPAFLAGEDPYDVIFCRNVFIYLTAEARRRLLANLERLLAPGGLLFTGHAEVGILQQHGFAALPEPRTFACRRRPPAPPAGRRAAGPAPVARPVPASRPAAPPRPPEAPAAIPASPRTQDGPAADVQALYERALVLADRGRFAEAEALCRRHLEAEGAQPHADLYCLMGLIHEAARRTDAAEASYLKALYLDPGHYESLVHLSLLYRQQGDDRKARSFIRRAEAQERRADGIDGA